MTPFRFADGAPGRILCLGAHSDDIEIGCAGTVLKLLGENPGIEVHWVVFSAGATRAAEAKAAAGRVLARAADSDVIVHDFRDGYFPSQHADIKDAFEALKGRVDPDVIFTHARDDLHQDHRVINELTWNTFRRHLVLEYEVPKWDGDIGRPNCYVHLSEDVVAEKVAILESCFASQAGRHWFGESIFRGIMRIRGMECNAPSGYAEAFYGRKIVW